MRAVFNVQRISPERATVIIARILTTVVIGLMILNLDKFDEVFTTMLFVLGPPPENQWQYFMKYSNATVHCEWFIECRDFLREHAPERYNCWAGGERYGVSVSMFLRWYRGKQENSSDHR